MIPNLLPLYPNHIPSHINRLKSLSFLGKNTCSAAFPWVFRPRGDVQIQDLFVELILHRVEEDTWENIIESLLQGLDVTEVNGLVQKIETGNHRFLKIMGLSCHFSLKPIRSPGKHLQFDDDDAHLFYESYKYIYTVTLGKMEETSDN